MYTADNGYLTQYVDKWTMDILLKVYRTIEFDNFSV